MCPSDSISGSPEDLQLYIDPYGRMDCGACSDGWPNEAIFAESDLPKEWKKLVSITAGYFTN